MKFFVVIFCLILIEIFNQYETYKNSTMYLYHIVFWGLACSFGLHDSDFERLSVCITT